MFKGKNIIITGGSSGIGEALAIRLFKAGANIALVARDMEKLCRVSDEISSNINGSDAKVTIYSCDITDPEKVEATVQKIVEVMGPPDVLINSAGILIGEYFENQTLADFKSIMDTNFYGTLHLIKSVLPYLKKKGGGHIYNVSSVAGEMGVFGYSSYCASKFAVNGLSESLRSELKPQGIYVHLILPPETDTPMVTKVNMNRPLENKMLAATAGVLSVDKVADDIIEGMEKGQYMIAPGAKTKLFLKVGRIMPSLARRIVDSTIKKFYKGPDG